MTIRRCALLAVFLVAPLGTLRAQGVEHDFTQAAVVAPQGLDKPEQEAIALLVDRVRERTGIVWERVGAMPSAGRASIVVVPARLADAVAAGLGVSSSALKAGLKPEGYRIESLASARAPRLVIVGADARGVLFGVGRFLRLIHTRAGRAVLPGAIKLVDAPEYPIRGQQLGYRPKTNSYDAWDLDQWKRYIADMAIFGVNTIELLPPRSDDAAKSPHFPRPQLEMMTGMSRICADYGLDVSVWYPAMDPDYTDPATVARALEEWASVLSVLPRLDDVFVPGGDPGHTRPGVLLALLEKQAANIRRIHPRTRMWVSAQGFSQQWVEEFLALLAAEPAWLSGVAYGPQTRLPLPELRKRVPARYPIRDYPDITHSLRCQYPVPDWDVAFSLTHGREGINPRPFDEAAIFHAFARETRGFVTYSEGCNDDVNKIVWSALGWNSKASLVETLREYARVLVGLEPGAADGFAQGLFALERNWKGALLNNDEVETTLARFRAMESHASPWTLRNWRFQQALYRAYYDAYVRRKLIAETELEARALDRLRQAAAMGALAAVEEAQAILRQANELPAPDLRSRVFELAEALFQSIGMQLSVNKYQAIAIGRGTTLDTIDTSLNNSEWLENRFAAIRKLPAEADRLREISAILNWTNPGPGGFYDDLGNPRNRPHLILGAPYEVDPAGFRGTRTGFDQDLGARRSWCRHAAGYYDAPVRMRYGGLDPSAQYRVRVVYTGDMFQVKLRLQADAGIEVHPFLKKPRDLAPLEFAIPRQATADGALELSWYPEPGRGGNGRGCQVAEVWLMRAENAGAAPAHP